MDTNGWPVDGAAASSRLTIQAERDDVGTRVALAGELDMDNAEDLLAYVHALTSQGQVRLEINVRHLTFCDSRGLSALLKAANACRRAGGELAVTEPAGAVRRVLVISGVESLLCPPAAGSNGDRPENSESGSAR